MESKKLNLLRSRSNDVTSGILFVGSVESNFYFSIRCPIHVAIVIEKAFKASSIPTRFYCGSVTISQLVLPQFEGKFIYRDLSGRIKKYNAAFVYPLDVNYEPCEKDYLFISLVMSVFMDYKYGYYDKKDRSISTLFSLFAPDYVEYNQALLENFVQSFSGSPAESIK